MNLANQDQIRLLIDQPVSHYEILVRNIVDIIILVLIKGSGTRELVSES
jgi:hypothetical protein